MTWKPFHEEEIIKVITDNQIKYLQVLSAEDLIYDERSYGTVATITLGASTRITNIEPKTLSSPLESVYMSKVGIDVGMASAELLAGTARRGTSLVPRPTSSNYYVGYFNESNSPFEDPHFKLAAMDRYIPAFSVYNPHGMTITPYFSFRGTKYDTVNLNSKEAAAKLAISDASLQVLLERLKFGAEKRIKPKTISLLGTMASGGT